MKRRGFLALLGGLAFWRKPGVDDSVVIDPAAQDDFSTFKMPKRVVIKLKSWQSQIPISDEFAEGMGWERLQIPDTDSEFLESLKLSDTKSPKGSA